MDNTPTTAKPNGMGCFTLFFLITILILIVAFGIDEGIGFFSSHCGGESIVDCILNKTDTMELTPSEKASMVTATGTYTYQDYSVTITAHIPLSGGPVSGVITGACEGKMTGAFNGEDGGQISGNMTGACSQFLINIPASATYKGQVNEKNRNVPISFSGKAAGFTHSDSMALSY